MDKVRIQDVTVTPKDCSTSVAVDLSIFAFEKSLEK